MEGAAPDALAADVLNEGRDVDEDGTAEALREAGEFHVGKASLVVPMIEDETSGGAREKKGLRAKEVVGVDGVAIAVAVDSANDHVRVVEAGQSDLTITQRRP